MRHPINLPLNNLMFDESLFVREAQEYLRYLSFYDAALIEVGVDGVFGPVTTRAVEQFQRQFRIQPTGRLDIVTWELLYAMYLAALAPDVQPLPPHDLPEEELSPPAITGERVG